MSSDEASSTPIEKLAAELGSEKGTTRQSARNMLVSRGKEAIEALTNALSSSDKHTVWEATKALRDIEEPEGAPGLTLSLGHRESDVRWLAAEGLVRLKRVGLEALLRALETHGDFANFRQGAHHVLHDFASGELAEIVKPVLTALDDIAPEVEAPVAAAKALKQLRGD